MMLPFAYRIDRLARLDRQMLMDTDWNDLYERRHSILPVLVDIAEQYGCVVKQVAGSNFLYMEMKI